MDLSSFCQPPFRRYRSGDNLPDAAGPPRQQTDAAFDRSERLERLRGYGRREGSLTRFLACANCCVFETPWKPGTRIRLPFTEDTGHGLGRKLKSPHLGFPPLGQTAGHISRTDAPTDDVHHFACPARHLSLVLTMAADAPVGVGWRGKEGGDTDIDGIQISHHAMHFSAGRQALHFSVGGGGPRPRGSSI